MASYSVAEAKNRLPAILREVEAGESAIITRHGAPVAEIRSTIGAPRLVEKPRRDAFYAALRKRHARTPPLDIDSEALVRAMRDEGF